MATNSKNAKDDRASALKHRDETSEHDWEVLEGYARRKIKSLTRLQYSSLKTKEGRIKLQSLPTLGAVVSWRADKLRSLLRFCPYSEQFGMTQ